MNSILKTFIFINSELPGVEIKITERDEFEALELLDKLIKSLDWIKFNTVTEWEISSSF